MIAGLTIRALAVKGLKLHWRAYIWVLLANATATAVITGALLVGDSIRGSLADRVLERLGRVEDVLIGPTFFRQELAAEVSSSAGTRDVVPAIVVGGSVVHATTRRVAGSVNVYGVPDEFWDLWDRPAPPPAGVREDLQGRAAVMNATLAEALSLKAGEAVLVQLEEASGIPAEYALGRRDADVPALRVVARRVLPDEGLALFDVRNEQRTPRNIFLPLELVARTIDKEGRANALLIAGERDDEGAKRAVGDAIRSAWTPDDSGLRIRAREALSHVLVESRDLLISDEIAGVLRSPWSRDETSGAGGPERLEVLTYLADTIRSGGGETPYSTVTAIGGWRRVLEGAEEAPMPVFSVGGIEQGEVIVHSWLAEDLEVEPGDSIDLVYSLVDRNHELVDRQASFRVKAVVPLSGLAADPRWTPEYPGISDATTMNSWDPPIDYDIDRIREKDEKYWDDHRTTPKAFLDISDGERLWSNRFGNRTSFRFRSSGQELSELARQVELHLKERLDPATTGSVLRALRSEGLEAARGSTDFSGLFLALSFFLIVSALILLSAVFRLSCERRSSELGTLAAVGFPTRSIAKLLFLESVGVAAAGTAVGLAGGVAYGAALIVGLTTLWKGAISAPFLSLHVGWPSLAVGAASTVILSLATLGTVSRRIARTPPRRLLGRGGLSRATSTSRRAPSRWSAVVVGLGVVAAVTLVALGSLGIGPGPEVGFFGAGACLLVSGLALVRVALRRPRAVVREGKGVRLLARLGLSYAGRAPGRSLTTVSLIACASFLVIAVAANRGRPPADDVSGESGDGGFRLAARSSVPLTASLSTEAGRETLGISPETSRRLEHAEIYPLRVREGDDISCLNVYRPRSPRVLGAPRELIERGGFAWTKSLAESEAELRNPWLLLDRELDDGSIPAVGDTSTVTWILHSGLGEVVEVEDERGRPVRLRLVGLLSGSIFQSELLVSERSFLRLFPSVDGHRFFLLDVPKPDAAELPSLLEEDLAPQGVDVETTAAILSGYREVTETYLSTFALLGWLGLALGTLGLGVVLARNVEERRAELALLRALGFPRGSVGGVILAETGWLLVLGLAVGGLAALLPLVPALGRLGSEAAPLGLVVSIGAIIVAGFLSAWMTLRSALRAPLIPSLREE